MVIQVAPHNNRLGRQGETCYEAVALVCIQGGLSKWILSPITVSFICSVLSVNQSQ
jgi:hypothetical protein